MSPYGEGLKVEHEKVLHPLDDARNPACGRCGWRTYPLWGPHDCQTPHDIQRTRHVAGHILSQLSFYRIPAEQKVHALAVAIAFSIAADVPDAERADVKWKKLADEVTNMIQKHKGQNPATTVQDVSRRPKLKIKKKRKEHCKKCVRYLHGRCVCGWQCPCYDGTKEHEMIDKTKIGEGHGRTKQAHRKGRQALSIRKRRR